ncbi:MAG: hypothetical protein ABSB26_08655 [Nitrososphaerales archaeon]
MKHEPSILVSSLRAVALVITLVSIVTLTTVGYSAYADVSNVINTVGGGSPATTITSETVVQGSAATVYLNVTLANRGLYPVSLSLTCLPPGGSGIACTSPSIIFLPGQSQTLQFVMTVENYSQFVAGKMRVDGQVIVTLEPFASITVAVDLGTLVARGEG